MGTETRNQGNVDKIGTKMGKEGEGAGTCWVKDVKTRAKRVKDEYHRGGREAMKNRRDLGKC